MMDSTDECFDSNLEETNDQAQLLVAFWKAINYIWQ